jgi:hypothetical protein
MAGAGAGAALVVSAARARNWIIDGLESLERKLYDFAVSRPARSGYVSPKLLKHKEYRPMLKERRVRITIGATKNTRP